MCEFNLKFRKNLTNLFWQTSLETYSMQVHNCRCECTYAVPLYIFCMHDCIRKLSSQGGTWFPSNVILIELLIKKVSNYARWLWLTLTNCCCLSTPIALWAAHQHTASLRYWSPEFESWLEDPSRSRPHLSLTSLPVRSDLSYHNKGENAKSWQ